MSQAWDNDKLIRINMTTLAVSVEDYPQAWKFIGG
jgi:hypothetical protein